MSKSKKNLRRKPQNDFNLSDVDEIIQACARPGLGNLATNDEQLEEYICEYNSTYAVPNEDEIPQRKNYPKRNLREIRDLRGYEDPDLTELLNHIVNDEPISPNNRLINRDHTEFADLYALSNLRNAINAELDYIDIISVYINNLKQDLLNLPDHLRREKALLIFSLQDLLGSIVNAMSEREYYHDIIDKSLIDTVRKLADGKINAAEAKKIARDHEISLEGFTRIDECITTKTYMDPLLELEDLGFPSHDARLYEDEFTG